MDVCRRVVSVVIVICIVWVIFVYEGFVVRGVRFVGRIVRIVGRVVVIIEGWKEVGGINV